MHPNDLLKNAKNVTATVVEETYNTGIVSINAAMAITTALAWHQTANSLIKKYVPTVRYTEFNIVYACMVTVLSSLVFLITQKYLKPSVKKTQINPVISYKA
jgi:hypothetical protein